MVSRTSRKKNKGKERKAKKVKNEREIAHKMWWGMAKGDAKFVGKTVTCDHGFGGDDLVPNDIELPNDLDHPVASFMNDLIVNWNRDKDGSVLNKITSLFKTHTQVWNDDSYKKMVINIMIRIGTNNMLVETGANIGGAISMAKSITLLEHYNGDGCLNKTINSRRVQTKMRDLNSSTCIDLAEISNIRISNIRSREVLKFFFKRISCSCLKEMYQVARRTQPKTGNCFGCRQEKERVALSVCSRCMVHHYCSRKCQVADWPKHKKECDILCQSS